MNLEGFSKKGMELGDSPEQLYKEHQNDVMTRYRSSIRRLADMKTNEPLLFNGMLESAIRRFNSEGLNVTKESVLEDVKKELSSRFFDLDDDVYNNGIIENSELNNSINNENQVVDDQLAWLKANMRTIFEGSGSTSHSQDIQEEQGVKHR